eukprot:5811517-Amphidinium_carterae.1
MRNGVVGCTHALDILQLIQVDDEDTLLVDLPPLLAGEVIDMDVSDEETLLDDLPPLLPGEVIDMDFTPPAAAMGLTFTLLAAKAKAKAKATAKGKAKAMPKAKACGRSAPRGLPFQTRRHRIMWYKNHGTIAIRSRLGAKRQLGSVKPLCLAAQNLS